LEVPQKSIFKNIIIYKSKNITFPSHNNDGNDDNDDDDDDDPGESRAS
jgi:hypothetical protein